jgi:hypothetical protein
MGRILQIENLGCIPASHLTFKNSTKYSALVSPVHAPCTPLLGFNATPLSTNCETGPHSLWELPSCLAHARTPEPPKLLRALSRLRNVARTGDTTVGDSSSRVATLLNFDKRLSIHTTLIRMIAVCFRNEVQVP